MQEECLYCRQYHKGGVDGHMLRCITLVDWESRRGAGVGAPNDELSEEEEEFINFL